MTQSIKNVMAMGAGGIFGTEVLAALQKEGVFNLSILTRKSSKSTFPPGIKVHRVDDDYPMDQLLEAFQGQDALVSTLPGRPYTVHLRMIDAAIQAGTKNRPIFVASFTVSQREVLEALQKATDTTWKVDTMSSADALKRAAELDNKDHSEGLKLLILMLLYADDADRGADFDKFGLSTGLLGLPEETLTGVIDRIVKRGSS